MLSRLWECFWKMRRYTFVSHHHDPNSLQFTTIKKKDASVKTFVFEPKKKKKEMKKIEILLTVGQSCVHKSFKKKNN